jgi:hypothetical protein
MNLFGHFEALLHQRFPSKRLAVRNFARPADEVGNRQRPNDYTKLDDPMSAFGADTYLLFFGFNESFAGPAAVETFKADYAELIRELRTNYPRDDTKAVPRLIIVSPIAVEPSGDPLLPDAIAQNAALALYRDAARDVAAAERLPSTSSESSFWSNTLGGRLTGMADDIPHYGGRGSGDRVVST